MLTIKACFRAITGTEPMRLCSNIAYPPDLLRQLHDVEVRNSGTIKFKLLPYMKILRSRYYFIILLSYFLIIPAYGITAKFSYTKLNNCAPTIVKFTNSSTRGPGITY